MTRFLGLRGSRLNYVALLGVVMPAIISLGYNQALLGGVLTLPWFKAQFPQIDVTNAHPSEKHHKSTLQGTVVALYAAGGFLGAIACIGLGDVLGRRRTIILTSVAQIIGAFLMASSFTFSQLVVSRVILGLGMGGQLVTVPIWQSEISPAAKRGAYVGTTGVFVAMGLTLALLVDLGMSYVPNSASWRIPVGLPIIFCLAVIIFTSHMPESPRWLVQQGQVSAAREVLAALTDTEMDSEMIEKEILDVKASLAIAGNGSLRQIFRMGHQRICHRASLAAGGLILLQLTGANCITFYSTTIVQTYLHLDSTTSRILAVIYQFSGVFGGIVCVFTIEGFGRRFLLLSSATVNTITMVLVAALSSQSTNNIAMYATVVFMFIFHFSMVVGFGGIPFLYASEVSPLSLRNTINGIGSGIYWALSVLITEVTPIAFNAIGWKSFLIFAALNFAMIPTIYLFCPETAGLSLEDIDEVFIMSTGWLDPVRVAKQLPKRLSGRQRQEDCHLDKEDNEAPEA
ncbi:Major facilitator superfamily domain general substrate transporter [Penicillium cf. griseofulvum]|uniref:Major facilitator superfamily domain general substrate transporter n=1 Tax=Penicillium cf. griseofulvum TaxID=2972120 RepID=A0A9W9MUB6_9EURO|nr:Major facilitator superfamily domain general substrate transporter [Penicillium cf. griseofulvum]KAJ5445809.1 Major facilitator superfamily domain general substrate transporter [Penicillium cf. griseofulvum]